ncbi:ArgS-related anticodon-binding protein NrtL [Streptomyces peucetius]|uniref:arginine--tRNA ligase n=1 Tax=Streptomyces peucetius TaxID=1950 RepID=A0ABY6IEV1_STRPE|nr:DALR anticodon-binding domain-containing protein [Streptomyces peucetius]UYQ64397.1 DALR anticodon-binding domain-containing protein [Streptomyces peucetius]
MTPAELSRTVRHAVCRAVEDGVLRVRTPDSVKIERPRPGGRGDYATALALRLAPQAGRPALEVAEAIKERIRHEPGIACVEVTGPGFLNFTLHSGAQEQLVRQVLREGPGYGAPRQPGGPFPHPDELRARVWADTLARLGAEARPGEAVRVLPAADQALHERLGADAARWALLAAAAHDAPKPGDGLLVQHERNPLFRVRYAHARARALRRNAAALGFGAAPDERVDSEDARALTAAVADHPAVVADAARLRAPDRLVRHLDVTADALLSFQGPAQSSSPSGVRHSVLPVGDEKPSAAHRARLALAEAAGTVLAGGLFLLGISAPDHL